MKQELNHATKYAVTGLSIHALLGALLGVLLIKIPAGFLLGMAFVIFGLLTVFNNVPSLIFGIFEFRSREGKVMFALSFVASIIGVTMIFFHNNILMIALGVYFVLIPLIRLIFTKDRAELLREELPKVIIGAVMILLGPTETMSLLFPVAGWLVIGLSALYLVGGLITLRRAQHKTGARVFVDTDGNGRVDTLYVDTTGDGKVDAATRMKEEK